MKKFYPEIKKYCLDTLKVVTQVALESTLRKKNIHSIHSKILFQVAVKTGNTLWCPVNPSQLSSKTMLLSYDVSKAGKVKKLIGVATCNESMTKYISASVNVE